MSPLDIVYEIVSYCTVVQHLCTREETVPRYVHGECRRHLWALRRGL